ncbi:dihydroneopterin aldolase [Lichenihabitans psoromatis]|uniref:dihydroneopterin aldolase n=1 Tax=Lichenihabitans psoromatis TaxID=2528642 RepID=UPI0013F17991|nr:dihydroneopterin aldolase [Lichenihabitans psoromatis]
MTLFLVSVRSDEEARIAVAAGADAVVVSRPRPDAFAPTVPTMIVDVAADLLTPAVDGPSIAIGGEASHGLVMIRETAPTEVDLDAIVAAGRAGIMLAAAGRLVDTLGLAALDDIASRCRSRGLLVGFSGGLESPDISRLLTFKPDILLVGRALRVAHRCDAPLDPDAIALFRGLFPQPSAAIRPAKTPAKTEERPRRWRDRIFVRDMVLEIDVGAYAEEFGRRQRVRFSIEAEIEAIDHPTRDMRDVVSYDLLTDTIRQVAGAGHVEFVETLAETIAARILGHPRLAAVHVTVEKLDLGAGVVGIDIWREAGG